MHRHVSVEGGRKGALLGLAAPGVTAAGVGITAECRMVMVATTSHGMPMETITNVAPLTGTPTAISFLHSPQCQLHDPAIIR